MSAVPRLDQGPGPQRQSPLESSCDRRLTDFGDWKFDADISPNGEFIAYGSDRDGVQDVWVAQIDRGVPVNPTRGRYGINDDAVRNLGFTSRGSRVWFLDGSDGERLLAAPLTGGTVEQEEAPRVIHPDSSRDGSLAVYHTSDPGDPLFVRETNKPVGEPILVGWAGLHQHDPVWSFDEAWIFFVRGTASTGEMDLWRVRPDGTGAEQLTHEQAAVAFPAPISPQEVLFVGRDCAGAGPWLWMLDLATNATRRVTVGMEQYVHRRQRRRAEARRDARQSQGHALAHPLRRGNRPRRRCRAIDRRTIAAGAGTAAWGRHAPLSLLSR